MKKYLVLLVLCVSLLAGCGTDKGTADNDGVLTPEYVCEEFGMDESEFEGVDFDAFVSYYGLTYDNIKEGDPRFLLNDYKAMEDKTEIPDYTSMKITTDKFLPEYQDKAEVVVIEM